MLIRRIKNKIKRIVCKSKSEIVTLNPIDIFLKSNSIPWSEGYSEYKWKLINDSIYDAAILKQFEEENIENGYGRNMDERVIEYPWLFSHLLKEKGTFLDAGSTFNFEEIISHPILENKDIHIYTYYPEPNNFASKRISYTYGDLRVLPFKNNFFDQVVCHSTLEHIDMDNSMYGYELSHVEDVKNKSFEYLKVINELVRVAKPNGKVFLTFPYGKFENHGFFQQFDAEMVEKIEEAVLPFCSIKKSFAKYLHTGWVFSTQAECNDALSYNPHTGKGKGNDNAAHSRAICFLEITKN
jgi:SAM-dependent methyltransferase